MEPTNMEQIKDWSTNIGLFPMTKPSLTVEEISQACASSRILIAEDLLSIITKASAYNIYLKTVKGTILAQISAAEGVFKKRMYLETQRVENKFLKIEEKEAQVYASVAEVVELDKNLTLLRMKYAKIKDIPLAIDNAIENMKLAYMRKLNETDQR